MTIHAADGRIFRRTAAEEHGIVSARVRPGYVAAVIDVSAGGALIEIARRLLPGAVVELQVETTRRQTTLRGRIVRCTVVRLRSSSMCYRAAIAFEYPVPIAEPSSSQDAGVDSTPDAV